jgi:hypothetical protein
MLDAKVSSSASRIPRKPKVSCQVFHGSIDPTCNKLDPNHLLSFFLFPYFKKYINLHSTNVKDVIQQVKAALINVTLK